MSLSYENIRNDILERNYSKVPFALSSKEMQEAANSFLDFLTLPLEYKEKFSAVADPLNPETEIGYRNRTSKSGKDNKEFFHYHSSVARVFKDLLKDKDPKVESFLNHAERVYDAAAESLRILLEAFEEKYPGISAKYFVEGDPEFYIRFLKYDTAEMGDFLAKAHYDRGTSTLALAESAPGLRIGRNESSLESIEHEEYVAVFMPGLTFNMITSKEFTPAWHDVVQHSIDRVSNDTSRWAIVLFADATGTPSPSEIETHTVKEY